MSNVLPISEVRKDLPNIVDLAAALSQRTLISVGGKVKAAIVNAQEFELMEETLEILSNPKSMKAIKKGKMDVKNGHLTSWEDLKAELGL